MLCPLSKGRLFLPGCVVPPKSHQTHTLSNLYGLVKAQKWAGLDAFSDAKLPESAALAVLA